MQKVYDFLKECRTYYLATVEGDQPRVRPFGTLAIFEEKLYIQTENTKDVWKQIQENPKVDICGFADVKWLRVSGKLVRDDRVEARERMLDQQPSLRAKYSATDGVMEVLYFEDATATFASFTDEPEVIHF